MKHSDLVKALKKPGIDIQQQLTAQDADLWHMSSCICGEAGELFDAVKKAVVYRKQIDRENIVEELGDLEFYLEGIRQNLHITREETIQANIEKLSARYKALTYSDVAAQKREDKNESRPLTLPD